MKTFTTPLNELTEFNDISRTLGKQRGMVQVSGCIDAEKAHLIYGLGEQFKSRVILTYSETRAKELYDDYHFFKQKVLLYPARDLLFYNADIQGNLLTKKRLLVLQSLLEEEELTVITTIGSCMERLLSIAELEKQIIQIENDSELNIEEMRKKLVQSGYEYVHQVEAGGQFAVRGGIIDIYPLTEENPIRIELWGDEVDSIRSFDAKSQRSIEKLERVRLYPAGEIFSEKKKTAVSFIDYFTNQKVLFVLDEPHRLLEAGTAIETEFRESMIQRLEKGYIEGGRADLLYRAEEVVAKMNQAVCIGLCTLGLPQSQWQISQKFNLYTKSVNPYNNSFELLLKDLKKWKKDGYRVILLSGSRTRAKRLAQDLQEYELNSFYTEDLDREVGVGEILVTYGSTHRGYEYPLIKFAVISESDIFGKDKRKKRKRRQYEGQKIQDFSEVTVGDYVVHENHGLGIYRGIEKIEVNKVVKDYMKIEYAGSGNLYILATQLDVIQKYASADAKKPKLNKLGTQEWIRTKKRVRSAVKDIAKDLVTLYATRQQQQGFVYGTDTIWQQEFEETFPFEETEDQLLAIEATKQDMESHKIMDRLICGDVGYGKTEIALRAAFKAAQEGKQVVYLVPTTILAQQHYNNFVQRMKDYPVRVDLLCRFRTLAEQRKTIKDLKKGLVDIVIGTHRVLSKDVEFKDLGMLVIDEEQRFGVTHKEKIKKLKENIDVLTLTATPIPRTLHMSLIGIRDMSVLEEAPQERVPIQTYVMEYNDEMVREAISREVARGGQVYYVYNRVETIVEMTNTIAKLLPEANVGFAHGQMKERELEQIMYDFINGEIDVLVSTTIIETGLDIANVNTMVIHDADTMGLSQLYQLRGRVGRSNRTAYAFLMYRRNKMLKEVAEKRLQAIREFTELGSGFKIAMRDLEIRGAGNLLGAQQHGHMEAVGYDLYCKMLNMAVKELKGEIPLEETFDTMLDLDIDAFISEQYIGNESQKLDIYKRIASIENEEEYDDMLEELVDRFGEPPKPVQNLLQIAYLRGLAHQAYITEISQKGDFIKFKMFEKAQVNPQKIEELINRNQGRLKFTIDTNPYFLYSKPRKNGKDNHDILEIVREHLNEFLSLK